jgi:hypothetical protein
LLSPNRANRSNEFMIRLDSEGYTAFITSQLLPDPVRVARM